MRKLDPDDLRPPYMQVVEALRADIEEGVFEPGERLPTHQQMVENFGVSVGTVKRALNELQGAGLVVSRQGQGAFVRTNSSAVGSPLVDLAEVRTVLADLRRRLEEVEEAVAKLSRS
ncbi:GntR family transcriptional regulator [Lentzea chajnantorensis]